MAKKKDDENKSSEDQKLSIVDSNKKLNKLEREIVDLSVELAENKTSSAYSLMKKTKELIRFREFLADEEDVE